MSEMISKFQELISPRFLLAYFLPFSIFYVAHWLLYLEVFTDEGVGDSLDDPKFLSAIIFLLALLGISYVVSPLNVLARRILEGNHIFKKYRDALLSKQMERHSELQDEIDEQRTRYVFAGDLLDKLMKKNDDNGEDADGGDAENAKSLSYDEAVAEIEASIKAIFHENRTYLEKDDIDFGELKAQLSSILNAIVALGENHGVNPDAPKKIEALNKPVKRGFQKFVGPYQERAQTKYTALYIRRDERFPRYSLQPTSLGNMRAALYSYALSRYGVGFDFLWRQITTLKSDDPKFSGKFLEKESQIEFLVNQLFLAGTFLIWPIIILFFSDKILLFVFMAVVPPLLAYFYYFVLTHAYYNSMIAKRSAIDLYRFDVLKSLHLRLPRTLEAEQEIWAKIQSHAGFGEAQVFRYDHDAS